MRIHRILPIALAACMLLAAAPRAQAFRPIMNDWQAYYNVCQNLVDLDCDACHLNGTTAFNPYGSALRTRINGGMTRIEAFVDAENIDSDNGGATNGQEIVVDCTAPGDASDDSAVPDEPTSWGDIKVLFR